MKFCPKCGTLMVPRRREGQQVYVCPKCGYEDASTGPGIRIARSINHSVKEKIIVVEGDTPKGLPKMKGIVCPKCGHEEAYYWLQQTRAADEPSTRFYKCVRCGHVWREYE